MKYLGVALTALGSLASMGLTLYGSGAWLIAGYHKVQAGDEMIGIIQALCFPLGGALYSMIAWPVVGLGMYLCAKAGLDW